MAKELFTIGYEGMALDAFVARLKNFAIDCLIDVREIPISRKRGFSKSGLVQRLGRENIHYVHFRELGSPKPIRQKLKINRDYSTFFKKMNKYLTNKKDALEKVYSYVIDNTCCLMCFEHVAEQCHRKIVARKIKEWDSNGLQIKDI